jgi:hypothetical protein
MRPSQILTTRFDDLVPVALAPGPVATVYLDTPADVEQAPRRLDVTWRTIRRDLERQGAPAETLDSIEPHLSDAPARGRCLAVVAGPGGIRHVEHGLAAPPGGNVARWGPLPMLTPILEWRQSRPPHLVVLADRTGATMLTVRYGLADLEFQEEGEELHARRSPPGGFSQRRFQQRAEDTWDRNARGIAEQVARLADRIEARLIAVSGDVRAVQLLREHLPEPAAGLLREVEVGGGRAADGSMDLIATEVDRMVDVLAGQETATLLDRFAEEIGQADRAVEGVGPTLEALSRSRVEVLLLAPDPSSDRTAWFGPEAVPVTPSEEPLRSLGVDRAEEGPLADVAVRAALGTGAFPAIVPAEAAARDGVGALLRWAD